MSPHSPDPVIAKTPFRLFLALLAFPGVLSAQSGTPAGGWDYIYHGDELIAAGPDEGFASLDGTWSHDNSSDAWDGSELEGEFGDGNRPGGVQAFDEGGITWIRIQDTGDPRDHGFGGDPSNRKIYFLHDVAEDGGTESVIDDGVTLIFRARVPTDGPLDPLHPDGQGSTRDYPSGGDGYVTSDRGKGNFVIRQQSGGAIAFSLTTATDTPGGDPDSNITGFEGLTMNEFDGNAPSDNVNFGQGEGKNVIPLDVDEWHEFWIVIREDESDVGTHVASFYIDGSRTPQVFKLTTGTGSDAGFSYLAMGSTATPQNSALDIDYFGVKFEAVIPEGASAVPPPDIVDLRPDYEASFVNPDGGVGFRATSEGSIPEENIRVILNGVDHSAQLAITGTERDRSVTLNGLAVDTFYEGRIHVTDAEGAVITSNLSFDTFSTDNRIIEAENFNFDQGGFIDMPDLFGDDSYFDKGVRTAEDSEGVDYHELSSDFNVDNEEAWRFPISGNMPNTVPNGNEAGRDGFTDGENPDYSVNDTQAGEWINYTRNFTIGMASVYLRASGGAFEVELHRVTGDAGIPDQTTELLGSFSTGGTGGRHGWIPLTDTDGQVARIELQDEVTLRAVIVSGTPSLNFFMVTPPVERPAGARLSITIIGQEATIEWDGGTLIWSRDLLHPIWREALEATSPYTIPVGGLKNFYAVGTPTPQDVIEAGVRQQVADAVGLREEMGDAAWEVINRGGRHLQGERYSFALQPDGVFLAHAADPALTGENLHDLQDSNGTWIVREIIDKATEEGAWTETYFFGNPASGETEPKRVWAVLHDGVVHGSGYYPDQEVLCQEMVRAAIERYDEVGTAIYDEITGTTNYVNGEIYLFMNDLDGISLAHSTRPEIVGTDRSNIQDVNGVFYVTGLIQAARDSGGGGWFNYHYTNFVTNRIEPKRVWAVIHDDKVFAAGWYP